MSRASLLAAALLLYPAATAHADGSVFDVLKPDTGWTLFRPTPRDAMRPIAVDTQPTTLDAGHVQVEVDLVDADWTRNAQGERRIDLFGVNARLGLSDSVDVQLHWVPYRETRHAVGDTTMADRRGVGDTRLRFGLNLWGNHGGRSAAALMPYLRLPTATGGVGTGAVEGGVVIPVSIQLPLAVEVRLVAEAEFAENHGWGSGVHPRFAVSGGLARDVVGPVRLAADWRMTADVQNTAEVEHELSARATVALDRDMQLDVGASVGLPDVRAMLHPYLRMTVRR